MYTHFDSKDTAKVASTWAGTRCIPAGLCPCESFAGAVDSSVVWWAETAWVPFFFLFFSFLFPFSIHVASVATVSELIQCTNNDTEHEVQRLVPNTSNMLHRHWLDITCTCSIAPPMSYRIQPAQSIYIEQRADYSTALQLHGLCQHLSPALVDHLPLAACTVSTFNYRTGR